MTYREEEAVMAKTGAKCFYTNRRPARKCSNKVGVRFCPSPCKHKVEPQYAIPVRIVLPYDVILRGICVSE